MGLIENCNRVKQNVENIYTVLEENGIVVPEGTTSDNLGDLISTNTVNLDDELAEQDSLLAELQSSLEGKAAGGGGSGVEVVLQTKTVTPSTSQQTITADEGYTALESVTVNKIPDTYVEPRSTRSAATYTPTTTTQIIGAGTYCEGVQTIKGDVNLVAGNIKNGISIFGVTGSYEGNGGSGGGSSIGICTIIVNGAYLSQNIYYTTIDENENITSTRGLGQNLFSFTAVCGTSVIFRGTYIGHSSSLGQIWTCGSFDILQLNDVPPGSTVTVNLTQD